MKQILLERKNLIAEHDTECNYLYLNWTGFQTEEEIYESGNQILEIFKKLNCSQVLNDNRKVVGPWNKASEWTQNVWFPGMVAAGLKQFAWVFPDNVFAQLSASQAMPDTDFIKKFQTYESAEQWLSSVKEPVS